MTSPFANADTQLDRGINFLLMGFEIQCAELHSLSQAIRNDGIVENISISQLAHNFTFAPNCKLKLELKPTKGPILRLIWPHHDDRLAKTQFTSRATDLCVWQLPTQRP
jgi:hypothetical protein